MHDAMPGDIYADDQGKLWRVVGVCREPTVIVREVERRDDCVSDENATRSGGVSGYMWHGYTRIYRPKTE